jgi:hypothetical protein
MNQCGENTILTSNVLRHYLKLTLRHLEFISLSYLSIIWDGQIKVLRNMPRISVEKISILTSDMSRNIDPVQN